MSDWRTIDSAPKNGSTVTVCRVLNGERRFQGQAAWRTVTFPSFINGLAGVEPEYTATGWMYPDKDKRVPEPTHWLPE